MLSSSQGNPNDLLVALGYSAISNEGIDVLSSVIGSVWLDWLAHCHTHREQSVHWESLRSALMAISEPVETLLKNNQISSLPERRVEVFLRQGRPLRAAVATLHKSSTPDAMQAARSLLRSSFKATAPELQAAIASKVHKVFGARAAVAFEVAKTKTDQTCLQVEAGGRAEARAPIDWANKIVLQLDDVEVLKLIAVLNNRITKVEYTGHGKALDKRMGCEKQKGGWKLSVRQAHVAHVLPLPAFEAFKIVSLSMRVLLANSPHLSPEIISTMANDFALLSTSET
jgi:hypothetical protein